MAEKKLSAAAQEAENYFARMEQRQAPAWMPEPGTTIRGTVKALRMGGLTADEGGYGRYPIIIYRVVGIRNPGEADFNVGDHGDIAVHAFHTLIRERLAELKTAPGSDQFVTYLGTRESRNRKDKDGKPVAYHNYDAENVGSEAEAEIDLDFKF